MAIGPRIFMDKYKDLSIDELNDKLRNLKIYLKSDELKKARKEEIRLGIDDNNCVTNVESEIKAIEILIKEKSENGLKGGNVQIKDIIVEYQKNGITDKLVELLNCFSNEIIKDDKQDPFWTDSAKNIFNLLLLSDLLEENEITIQLLLGQTRTCDRAKKIIGDNIDKLNKTELNKFMTSASILNSDKPFKSIVEIIYNALLFYDRIDVKNGQVLFLSEEEISKLEKYNITYNEAVKKASEYFKGKFETDKISKAYENSKCWIFYPYGDRVKYSGHGIKIDKITGEISIFILPNDEDFDLLDKTKEIEVPQEFKLTTEDNENLIKAIKIWRDKKDGESFSKVIEEMKKTKFNFPVKEMNEMLMYATIRNSKGEKLLLAFTSLEEFHKWNKDKDVLLKRYMFEDYAKILLDSNNVDSGFVIDPFGVNLVFDKRAINEILKLNK